MGGGGHVHTVYIDILFATNLFIDYLLLLVTAKFAGKPCSRRRLLAAAALGGSLAVCSFFFPPSQAMALPFRGLCCLALCGLAFRWPMFRELCRLSLIFLAVTLAFGGAVFATAYLRRGPGIVSLRGGALCCHVPLGLLLGASAAAYLLLGLVFGGNSARGRQKPAKVQVRCGGRSVVFDALWDTGNQLRDPVTTRKATAVREGAAVSTLYAGGTGVHTRLGAGKHSPSIRTVGALRRPQVFAGTLSGGGPAWRIVVGFAARWPVGGRTAQPRVPSGGQPRGNRVARRDAGDLGIGGIVL